MNNITEHPDFGEMCRAELISDECSLSREVAGWQIDDLRTFCTTLERLIDAEDARISAMDSGPPEDYSGWWIQDVVARQLRLSFVAACLDATAYHLTHVCQDVATIIRQNGPDLGRDAIKRARRFLVDAGFSSPPPSQWDEMLDLYRFRNTVVHAMAMTPDGRTSRRCDRLLRRAPGITACSGAFDLTAEFTEYVYQRVSAFFSSLHRELVAMCRRVATQADATDDHSGRC